MLRFAFKIGSEFRHFHEPLLNLWVNDSYQNPGTRIQIKRARDDTALSHWISLVSKTLDRMKLSLLFFSLFFSLSYVLFGTPSRLELIGVVGVSFSFIKPGPANKRASLVTTSTIPLPACGGKQPACVPLARASWARCFAIFIYFLHHSEFLSDDWVRLTFLVFECIPSLCNLSRKI